MIITLHTLFPVHGFVAVETHDSVTNGTVFVQIGFRLHSLS